jgi:hypothetical protein
VRNLYGRYDVNNSKLHHSKNSMRVVITRSIVKNELKQLKNAYFINLIMSTPSYFISLKSFGKMFVMDLLTRVYLISETQCLLTCIAQ